MAEHGKFDLAPSTDRILGLIPTVSDEHLAMPSTCEGRTVSELIGHLVGLTGAFRAAADKDLGPWTDTSPSDGGWPEAEDDWREVLAERLPALVTAWYPASAWEGMTRAGGVDLPGEVAGLVALDEVTLHGWDLARSIGQPYDCDDATAEALVSFAEGFDPGGTEGMFGPAVEVPGDASTFDRVLGRTGRDPDWTPGSGQAS